MTAGMQAGDHVKRIAEFAIAVIACADKIPIDDQVRQFLRDIVIFVDKCPQNGSKNDPMVPRTSVGCPHEGPRVESRPGTGSA